LTQGWLIVAALAGVLLLAIWQATTNFRLNRAMRHYRHLSAGVEGQPLDQLLQRILDRHDIEMRTLRELEERVTALGEQAQGHLQNVGIVRYNAFEDTGGDQSFAIALLDNVGAGAVFNGLYHRTVCRVYAKPVRDWKSTYSLSDEEEEAIRKARAGVPAAN
jgi:non-ribosomal peptide synthetase component F